MATHSNINVKVGEKYHVVYCHNNGYLSANGKLLFEHYNSQELAEKLVSGGDLSYIDKSCDTPGSHHSFDTPVKGYSVYYARDRLMDEESIKIRISNEVIDEQEYLYVWDGKQWLVSGRDYEGVPLKAALEEELF